MAFGHISIPLPSTHSHHHRTSSTDHSPSPGHLPHASTIPATFDTRNHKHYHAHDLHHSNTTLQHSSSTIPHLPSVNPAAYLQKHRQEYTVQHSFSRAKHEASLSSASPIPEFPYTRTTPAVPLTNTSSKALTEEPSQLSLTATQQAVEDERRREQLEKDQMAWTAIVKAREAATRRSTMEGDQERPRMAEYERMSEGSVRTAGSRD